MKMIPVVLLGLAAAGASNAQDIQYRFTGVVTELRQTDLDPLYLWDSSVELGSSFNLDFRIPVGAVDGHPDPRVGDYSSVHAILTAGDYSFSSAEAFFSLRNDFGGLADTDGFMASFTSAESYFGAPFQIGVPMASANLDILDSDQLVAFAATPFVVTPNSFGEGNTITVSAGTAQMVLRADFVGASIIPEPSTYAAIAGIFALGVVTWRRRQGGMNKRSRRCDCAR